MTKTEELKSILAAHPFFGFDVETDKDGHLVCFSLAWGPTLKQTACFFTQDIVFPVKELDEAKLIIHYAKGTDIPAMNMYGQNLHCWVDTYVASKLHFWRGKQYEKGKNALKTLAQDLLGMPEWGSADELIRRYGSMREVPRPMLEIYNRTDALAHWRLWVEYFDDKFENKFRDLLFTESALMHVLERIRKVGMLFDKTRIGEIKSSIQEELLEITKQIYEISPGYPFRSAGGQLDHLFNKLGISKDGWPMTAGGKKVASRPKLDQPTFEQFQDRHPILKLLVIRSSLNILMTTYVDRYAKMCDENSVFHPEFDAQGSSTGRFSSNMQNVPKTMHGRRIREAFVARPGFRLASIDYSGAQLYAAAFKAEDEVTIEALRDPTRDTHTETAILCHGYLEYGDSFLSLSISEQAQKMTITPEQRNEIKGTTFGKLFNPGWPAAFLKYTGDNWREAEKLQNVWYSRYPGIARWHKWILTEGADEDFTETFFGRRQAINPVDRTFHPAFPPEKKAWEMKRRCAKRGTRATNHPVQGTEGDISKFGIVQADEYFERQRDAKGDVGHILILVHDEILVEIREDRFDELLPKVMERFANIPGLPIPMKCDAKVGPNWFDLKKWSPA